MATVVGVTFGVLGGFLDVSAQNDCREAPLNLLFQETLILETEHQTAALFANVVSRVISDAITIFSYLFLSGREPSCHDAADANDDGRLDISCLTILLDFFREGTAISSPGPFACGPDPTEGNLSCLSYSGCP
jgi:hypothetical protein